VTNRQYTRLILFLLLIISIISAVVFYQTQLHLLYGDALSRLNISRKLTDSLTPGLGQLGNVWLPLPQILMMPFTANKVLWQSGLAGTIVSTFFFILGGFAISQTLLLLTRSKVSATIGFCVYALNINMLYMQTTAMSEAAFIGVLSVITLTLTQWHKTRTISSLLMAAIFTSAITLIRYEGLAILASSILFVIISSLWQTKSRKKTEGNLILFTTLAVIGFSMWTLYLTAIFGDPLYWKNYYAGDNIAPGNIHVSKPTDNPLFALWWYFVSVAWMNGLAPVGLALIGNVLMLWHTLKEKTLNYFPIFLHVSIVVFMMLTLMRNTPINQPHLTIANILNGNTSALSEFNIRYGMLMLPFVALAVGVLSSKSRYLAITICLLFSIQIINYFLPTYSSIYQFRIKLTQGHNSGKTANQDIVKWMQDNYDDGLILISAARFDPLMFKLGLNYDRYIHEGTQHYWKTSLQNPKTYAKWIILNNFRNSANTNDPVTNAMFNNKNLSSFSLVFKTDKVSIYKRR